VLQNLVAQHVPIGIARDHLHHHKPIRLFVGRDLALHEKSVQRIERDRLIGLRHDRGEDAVADDWVRQHEARRIEKPRKALIERIELGCRDGKAAIVEKLGIALRLKQISGLALEGTPARAARWRAR
jgi:hypothetical protein